MGPASFDFQINFNSLKDQITNTFCIVVSKDESERSVGVLAHADRVDERGQEALVLGHDVVGERLQRRAPALLRVQRVPPELLSVFVSINLKIVNLKFSSLFLSPT